MYKWLIEISNIVELLVIFLSIYTSVFFLLLYLDGIKKHNHKIKRYPTVSIVIPMYNEENKIGQCIKHVQALDYPKSHIEIIVVDDGSTDKSAQIVKSLAKQDSRIKYIFKKNSGKADSLNKGIEIAQNELIATLDADTYVEKDSLKHMVAHIESGADAVVPVTKVYNKDKNFITNIQSIEYLVTSFLRKVLETIDSIYVTPGTFSLFKRDLLVKVGGFDPTNILEDQEIAIRFQSYNYTIETCLDAVVYTEVPETFGSLVKQRERWHRGGLRNSLKYLNLINPKYGDFGIFIMPMSIITIILLFALLGDVIFMRFIVNPPMFIIDSKLILTLILFSITFIWTWINLNQYKNEKISYVKTAIYILLYSYFITFIWLISIPKELLGVRLIWK